MNKNKSFWIILRLNFKKITILVTFCTCNITTVPFGHWSKSSVYSVEVEGHQWCQSQWCQCVQFILETPCNESNVSYEIICLLLFVIQI